MAMTETPEVDYGKPQFVTSCAFLPIVNPKGGKRLDIYGVGKPVPASAMTDEQIQHFLRMGMIEHTDGKGNVDRFRAVECLTAIITCCSDDEGFESWGRPRIAERLRANGFAFSNKTFGIAIRMLRSDWKSGDPLPSERG
jgi:hypothetical protein